MWVLSKLFGIERKIEKAMAELSDDGKIALIRQLVEKGKKVPDKHVGIILCILEERGDIRGAAGLAKDAGMFEEAAKYLIREGDLECAADQYMSAGMRVKAAELYMDAGRFGMAAANFEQEGVEDKAKAAYIKAAEQEIDRAVKGENRFHDPALNYSRAGYRYRKAGEIQKANETFLKAARLYEERKKYKDAAVEYEKIGLDEKARELYIKHIVSETLNKGPGGVVKLAKEKDIVDRVIDVLIEKRIISAFYFAYEAKSPKLKELAIPVMEFYENLGNFKEARDVAKKAGIRSKVRSYSHMVALDGSR
jgi:tetratricopeptide (TPR) repeat protein